MSPVTLRRVRPGRRASITSLIDVIFLLLLFFMLASTFSKFSEIELSSASGSPAPGLETPAIIRLQIEPDGFLLDGEALTLEQISARLPAMSEGAPVVVLISAADTVTTQRLTDILTHLGALPGLTLQVLEPT